MCIRDSDRPKATKGNLSPVTGHSANVLFPPIDDSVYFINFQFLSYLTVFSFISNFVYPAMESKNFISVAWNSFVFGSEKIQYLLYIVWRREFWKECVKEIVYQEQPPVRGSETNRFRGLRNPKQVTAKTVKSSRSTTSTMNSSRLNVGRREHGAKARMQKHWLRVREYA